MDHLKNPVLQLSLPAYTEIPDVGLFLDQVCRYINEFLEPLPGFALTTSMISNYVKKGLISNPVKKQYGREQIAYLFFVAVAKSVLSIDDLHLLIRLQQLTHPMQKSYEYFRLELQNVLEFVFEQKEEMDLVGVETSREKAILRNAIIAVAHKVYLNQMLAVAADKISGPAEK